MVYSTRRFVLHLTLCYFVLVYFSPFSISITSLGEETANLSAFRSFVLRFVLVWFCRFPLPLGVWDGLWFVIVALPGLLSYFFFIWCHYLFLISPSFGAQGRLCIVIVVFTAYLHTSYMFTVHIRSVYTFIKDASHIQLLSSVFWWSIRACPSDSHIKSFHVSIMMIFIRSNWYMGTLLSFINVLLQVS